MKSLFLTGGHGFLGKHIQASFIKKYKIFAPTRQELELTDLDAVNKYFSRLGELDYILNSASVGVSRNSTKSEKECLYENIYAFKNIYQYGSRVKKFIQFGSGAEYSKPFKKSNVSEEEVGECLPNDVYGVAKFFAGNLLELQEPGRFVNLRLFGVFGPHENYKTRFISNAIARSLFDMPIMVNQNAEFDYVYAQDFVKIVNYFIENKAPYVSYNITSGQSVTLVELAEIIKKVTGNKRDILIRENKIKETYTGSNKRLRSFLPVEFMFTPIVDAIEDLVIWYENNRLLIDKACL